MQDLSFIVSPYNCKNIKSSMDEVRELCARCDIVFLQETWLSEAELPLLSQISPDFYCKGLSAMDTRNGVLIGRPFGGIAILWRKTLGTSAALVLYGESRLLGLELTTCSNNVKILVINAYLPCSSAETDDQFVFYLSKLDSIVSSADTN